MWIRLQPDERGASRLGALIWMNVGHSKLTVEITPDNLLQSHVMRFEIDPSYLRGIVEQCARILAEYPVRGM